MYEYGQIVHNITKNTPYKLIDRWDMDEYDGGLSNYTLASRPKCDYLAEPTKHEGYLSLYGGGCICPTSVKAAQKLLDDGVIVPKYTTVEELHRAMRGDGTGVEVGR